MTIDASAGSPAPEADDNVETAGTADLKTNDADGVSAAPPAAPVEPELPAELAGACGWLRTAADIITEPDPTEQNAAVTRLVRVMVNAAATPGERRAVRDRLVKAGILSKVDWSDEVRSAGQAKTRADREWQAREVVEEAEHYAETAADDDASGDGGQDDIPDLPEHTGKWHAVYTVTGDLYGRGKDDYQTWRLKKGTLKIPPTWVRVSHCVIRFGAEYTAAPDPDFPERAEEDSKDAVEGASDITVRMLRGGRVIEKTIRGVDASRARDLKFLDQAGATAWRGMDPSATGRNKMFAASLLLSEEEGRDFCEFYNVPGHRVIRGRDVIISGVNAIDGDGLRPDLMVRMSSQWHWAAFQVPLLAGAEMTAGLRALMALARHDGNPKGPVAAKVIIPVIAGHLRAAYDVYRAPDDVTAENEASSAEFLNGPTAHGKSSISAAAGNVLWAALRFNALPFKAGPGKNGELGLTGPALDRVLFKGRGLCIPMEDIDPSIPPGVATAWVSMFARRLADQAVRTVAEGAEGLRAPMPARCLAALSAEPMDTDESGANRILNVPVVKATVNLAEMKARTGAAARMLRARFGAAVLSESLKDWAGAQAALAAHRTAAVADLQEGRPSTGAVMRAVDCVAELLAVWRLALGMAGQRGADPVVVEAARVVVEAAMRDALDAHLEVTGAGSRGDSFLADLRGLVATGGAALDDADKPGCPPEDAIGAGWELSGQYSGRRGPQVGWLCADGSVWLLPDAAVGVVKLSKERANSTWTGVPKTVGEQLKSDGSLVLHGPSSDEAERAAAQLPRPLPAHVKRGWHVTAEAWDKAGDPDDDTPATPGDDDGQGDGGAGGQDGGGQGDSGGQGDGGTHPKDPPPADPAPFKRHTGTCAAGCGVPLDVLVPGQTMHPGCGDGWAPGTAGAAENHAAASTVQAELAEPEETEPEETPEPEEEPETAGKFNAYRKMQETVEGSKLHAQWRVPEAGRESGPWPAAEAASWIAQHAHDWTRPGVEGFGTERLILPLDRHQSYPGSCNGVAVSPRFLVHAGPLEVNPKNAGQHGQAGICQVIAPAWPHTALIGHPLGRDAVPGEPLWVPSGQVEQLWKLHEMGVVSKPEVTDSWLGRRTTSLFDGYQVAVRDARAASTTPEETADIKLNSSVAIRKLHPRDAKSQHWRPDWYAAICAEAATRLWIKAWHAVQAGGQLVRMGSCDAVWYLIPEGQPETWLPEKYELGDGPGKYHWNHIRVPVGTDLTGVDATRCMIKATKRRPMVTVDGPVPLRIWLASRG